MKIGINFGDNDYTPVIRDFFDLFIIPTFINRGDGHMVTHLTSSMIVELFNTHLPYLKRYHEFQFHSNWYPQYKTLYDFPLCKGYLIINESQVYFDDERRGIIWDWNGDNNGSFVFTNGLEVYVS